MKFLMIIMMHVGPLGNGNSNALTTAEFDSIQACEDARSKVESLALGSVKQIKTVCVKK